MKLIDLPEEWRAHYRIDGSDECSFTLQNLMNDDLPPVRSQMALYSLVHRLGMNKDLLVMSVRRRVWELSSGTWLFFEPTVENLRAWANTDQASSGELGLEGDRRVFDYLGVRSTECLWYVRERLFLDDIPLGLSRTVLSAFRDDTGPSVEQCDVDLDFCPSRLTEIVIPEMLSLGLCSALDDVQGLTYQSPQIEDPVVEDLFHDVLEDSSWTPTWLALELAEKASTLQDPDQLLSVCSAYQLYFLAEGSEALDAVRALDDEGVAAADRYSWSDSALERRGLGPNDFVQAITN